MEILLFTIGSLVVLVPIVYILPLGLSKRGKAVVLMTAFLIAILGILATPVLPLWQTSLIVMLIIGMVSYFMNNRIGNLLFTVEEENVLVEEIEPAPVINTLSDTYAHIAISDKVVKGSDVEEDTNLLQKAMRQAGDPKPSSLLGKEEDNSLDSLEFSFSSNEKLEVASAVLTDDESVIKDDFMDAQLENNGYLAEMEEYLTIEQEDGLFENDPSTDFDIEEIKFGEVERLESSNSLEDQISEISMDVLDEDELPELIFDEVTISEEKSSEDNSNEPEIESDFEEDDFWKNLLEDDLEEEEEKKETTATTDKLEKMWERVGLAKES